MSRNAQIQIYHLSLLKQGFSPSLTDGLAILDDDEQARYARFKNNHARDTFLQARYMLKTLLAEQLQRPAHTIQFSYTQNGKPYLEDTDYFFNMSHSHGNIVVALAPFNVGVDVEDVDRCASLIKEAENFMNAHVANQIRQCTTELAKAKCFTEYWCCMESYVKLRGSAIWQEKDRVEVQLLEQGQGKKIFSFEDINFLCYTDDAQYRIAVAYHTMPSVPEIHVHTWQR